MKAKSNLVRSCWSELRNEVTMIDERLASIIDEINPSDDLPLYVAEYPYGEIIDDGVFYYPDDNGCLRPLADESLAGSVREDFLYAGESTPTGIVLNKNIEVFTESQDTIAPWGVYGPGEWFGLSVRLNQPKSSHPTRLINMSSGVRSIYMLPNIGDKHFHQSLKHLLPPDVKAPKELKDQWRVFRELFKQNTRPEYSWSSKVILLSGSWLEKIKNDPRWSLLYLNMFNAGWDRSEFDRNRPFYDIGFSEAQKKRNLKESPYLVDTVKHLFKILAGGAPGFSIDNNEEKAPVKFLQDVYTNLYGLKEYFPHILTPTYLNKAQEERKERLGVYYSLNVPTTLEFSPKSRKDTTLLSKIKDIKSITNIFSEEMLKTQNRLGNTQMSSFIDSVDLEYFHDKFDSEGIIKNSRTLSEYDSALHCNDSKKYAYASPFLRGCVLISVKNLPFDS